MIPSSITLQDAARITIDAGAVASASTISLKAPTINLLGTAQKIVSIVFFEQLIINCDRLQMRNVHIICVSRARITWSDIELCSLENVRMIITNSSGEVLQEMMLQKLSDLSLQNN